MGGASRPSCILCRPTATSCAASWRRTSAARRRRADSEFKRQFGSDIPFVTPGGEWTADWFTTRLLEHTIAVSVERLGDPPRHGGLTHPAGWGPHRLDLLRRCVAAAGLPVAHLLPEPIAAATHYARLGRVSPGETVLIYDFGGGTFDAAVVRHAGHEMQVVGRPLGSDRVGGIDVDHAILVLVDELTGGLVTAADVDDPAVVADLHALRQKSAPAARSR